MIHLKMTTMTLDDIFGYLSELNRWVPYKLVFNPKRDKFDKVPDNGRHGLSTTDPKDWRPLLEALKTAKEGFGLSGVGFVMTSGVTVDDLTLVGFDFDGVGDDFTLPFETYTERSPSGKGVRAFAWAPVEWTKKYMDSTDTKPPFCEHAEIYIGTAPRFLTVTFDTIQMAEFKQLTKADLKQIEAWGMKPYQEKVEAPIAPETEGHRIDLRKITLTEDQRNLLKGTHKGDKSKTMQGLIVRLIDSGSSNEDVLATLLAEKNLWAYLLSHRSEDEDKALKFAKDEIKKAYALSMKGKREALVGFNKKWKTTEDDPKPDKDAFPMEVYDKAPGLVGEIAKWILNACYVPREEFAYATALSLVACLIGTHTTHGHGTRKGKVNLYISLIGPSGCGKSDAIGCMALLLNETEAKDCLLDFPASEAALRRQLVLTPNIILKVDELAHKLDAMKDGNGSSMGRAILEAYDSVRMPPKVYADSKNTLPAVENPFVQIIGGTTDKVWEVVRMSHLEDGTLNRFTFVCLPDKPEFRRNQEPQGDVPKALKDKINAFWRATRMNDLIGDVPGFGQHITYSKEVVTLINDLDKQVWELTNGEEFGNLYPRFVLNTTKVAAILAAGDGRKEINVKDFTQAHAFIRWCIATTAKKIGAHMSETSFGRLQNRLIKKLKKEGGKMNMRNAYKFLHINRRDMEELVNTMVLQGELDVVKEEEGVSEYLVIV
ncbi:MAG: hypothetical protein E6Q24_14600 [Chitinophagaceae bacterium]|nr:MAG: hypothetical protein E6Q24_14600 [Chitinophagaceae bacterium]